MKKKTIEDAMDILLNEMDEMNKELSVSKAPNEIIQLKQHRIDRLRKVYNTINKYKYLNVFDPMEEMMCKLQKLDSKIDGFLIEIKFTEKMKNSAMFSIRSTNMFKI